MGEPEVSCSYWLDRTLKRWRMAFLEYFDIGGSSDGGTDALNGLIELYRRFAGFRSRDNDDYTCCSSAEDSTHGRPVQWQG